MTNTTTHYHANTIKLHWLTVLLMIAVYACIELRELYPKGSDIREGFKTWHFMLGLTVFAVTFVRLYFRAKYKAPEIMPKPSPAMMLTAHLAHALLYLMMIGLPILGWLTLSAAGKPVPFFGLELPPLVAENEAFAKTLKGLHKTIGKAGYFLIAIHTLAALFHHYVVKDNTLLRMLKK
jgi:superoxide oxidase